MIVGVKRKVRALAVFTVLLLIISIGSTSMPNSKAVDLAMVFMSLVWMGGLSTLLMRDRWKSERDGSPRPLQWTDSQNKLIKRIRRWMFDEDGISSR